MEISTSGAAAANAAGWPGGRGLQGRHPLRQHSARVALLASSALGLGDRLLTYAVRAQRAAACGSVVTRRGSSLMAMNEQQGPCCSRLGAGRVAAAEGSPARSCWRRHVLAPLRGLSCRGQRKGVGKGAAQGGAPKAARPHPAQLRALCCRHCLPPESYLGHWSGGRRAGPPGPPGPGVGTARAAASVSARIATIATGRPTCRRAERASTGLRR